MHKRRLVPWILHQNLIALCEVLKFSTAGRMRPSALITQRVEEHAAILSPTSRHLGLFVALRRWQPTSWRIPGIFVHLDLELI